MKSFINKYWTHILNILFFLFFIVLMIYAEQLKVLGVIIMLIFIILIFVEMIYHIVIAAQDKEDKNNILHAIFCYLFNIFYIPCYRLKYVVKDKNYKIKNIIYLISSILLYIIIYIILIIIILNN